MIPFVENYTCIHACICKAIFWKESHQRVNGRYLQVWEIIFSPFWGANFMLFEFLHSKGIVLI